MGPHSFKCGSPTITWLGVLLLLGASMGPHSFKCGSQPRVTSSSGCSPASMGPHSFKCGSMFARAGMECGLEGLQWGRTLSSAEVTVMENRLKSRLTLQWGRTLSSAEVGLPNFPEAVISAASMGPHSFKCGSTKRIHHLDRERSCFNGAALFQVRK